MKQNNQILGNSEKRKQNKKAKSDTSSFKEENDYEINEYDSSSETKEETNLDKKDNSKNEKPNYLLYLKGMKECIYGDYGKDFGFTENNACYSWALGEPKISEHDLTSLLKESSEDKEIVGFKENIRTLFEDIFSEEKFSKAMEEMKKIHQAFLEYVVKKNGFEISEEKTEYKICMKYEISAEIFKQTSKSKFAPNWTHWGLEVLGRTIEKTPDQTIDIHLHSFKDWWHRSLKDNLTKIVDEDEAEKVSKELDNLIDLKLLNKITKEELKELERLCRICNTSHEDAKDIRDEKIKSSKKQKADFIVVECYVKKLKECQINAIKSIIAKAEKPEKVKEEVKKVEKVENCVHYLKCDSFKKKQ
jgi:hypothetical protein